MSLVTQRIRDYLKRHHPASRIDAVKDDQSLLLAGILDSSLMLDLVTYLEQSFQIQIDEDDLTPENFETIDAMVRYLKSRGVAGA